MAEFNLPDFTVGTETASDDIIKLLKIVKSDWDVKEIEIKTMSGGLSCSTYHAFSKINPDDGLTIRVRKLFTQMKMAIVDTEYERKIVQIMSGKGLFPKVRAMFKNGYCYDYIPGKPLLNWLDKASSSGDEKDVPFEEIAKNLAKIHCVNVEGEDYSKTEIFDKYIRVLEENYPNEASDPNIIEKSIFAKELKELIEHVKNVDLKIVLCHGDTHPGNIVWNQEKEHLTFVDWELTHIGYQVHDLAYFLRFLDANDPAKDLDLPDVPIFIKNPTKQLKKDFIRSYLEEFSRLTTGSVEYPEEQFVILEKQVNVFTPIVYLTGLIIWGSLYKVLIDSGLPAEMAKFMPKMFEYYKKVKIDVFG